MPVCSCFHARDISGAILRLHHGMETLCRLKKHWKSATLNNERAKDSFSGCKSDQKHHGEWSGGCLEVDYHETNLLCHLRLPMSPINQPYVCLLCVWRFLAQPMCYAKERTNQHAACGQASRTWRACTLHNYVHSHQALVQKKLQRVSLRVLLPPEILCLCSIYATTDQGSRGIPTWQPNQKDISPLPLMSWTSPAYKSFKASLKSPQVYL